MRKTARPKREMRTATRYSRRVPCFCVGYMVLGLEFFRDFPALYLVERLRSVRSVWFNPRIPFELWLGLSTRIYVRISRGCRFLILTLTVSLGPWLPFGFLVIEHNQREDCHFHFIDTMIEALNSSSKS